MEQRRRRVVSGTAIPPHNPWITSPARGFCRVALRRYFDMDHEGRANIPRHGPAIMISNHPTYVDPWMIGLGTERWITWMAWEDAFTWPFVGWFIRSMGAFPVNVERPQASTIKAAMAVLAEGGLLGMFFEGGRTHGDDVLDPPRRGGARMALMAECPIVPVTIAGARRLWPHTRPLPRPGKVVVRYHPPIDPRTVLSGEPSRVREERLTEQISLAIRSALRPDGRHRGLR